MKKIGDRTGELPDMLLEAHVWGLGDCGIMKKCLNIKSATYQSGVAYYLSLLLICFQLGCLFIIDM